MNTHNLELHLMYNIEVEEILKGLLEGSIAYNSFHNKKNYAKRSGNLRQVLNLVVAWELYKYEAR